MGTESLLVESIRRTGFSNDLIAETFCVIRTGKFLYRRIVAYLPCSVVSLLFSVISFPIVRLPLLSTLFSTVLSNLNFTIILPLSYELRQGWVDWNSFSLNEYY